MWVPGKLILEPLRFTSPEFDCRFCIAKFSDFTKLEDHEKRAHSKEFKEASKQ